MKFLIMIFALFPVMANAQKDTASTSYSRLYIPFGFGYGITQNAKTYSGNVVITAFEYRLKKSNGLFFRFNFDYHRHPYKILASLTDNVSQGKLEFNDYSIGLGNRFGIKKLKIFGLIQGGVSSYKYLYISGPMNNYTINERKRETSVFKGTVGIEYYLTSNVALVFETGYTIIPTHSIFWDKHSDIIEISLGLTSTLF